MGAADEVLAVLTAAAGAAREALESTDRGPTGGRAGQHHSDLATDAAVRRVLGRAGVRVLSEESGVTGPDADVTVVVDPLDGSTNAHRGIPWYAVSLCAVDREGPLAAVVADLCRPVVWTAVRGEGARRNGAPVAPSGCRRPVDAIVAVSGTPRRHLGWRQLRALGAAALDLCAVADGTLDAYMDWSPSAHGPWDYLGAWLVCTEAGAVISDVAGRELVVLDHRARRTPWAAATPELLAAFRARAAGVLPVGNA